MSSRYDQAMRELDRLTEEFSSKSNSRKNSTTFDESFASNYDNQTSTRLSKAYLASSSQASPIYDKRQLAHLDAKKTDHNYFSSTIKPTTNTISPSKSIHLHRSPSSYYKDISYSTLNNEINASLYASGSTSIMNSNSVLQAFRDLQQKVKFIEQERFQAIEEREELKNQLLKLKRNNSLDQSRIEIDSTESLLAVRNQIDKVKVDIHDLQSQIKAKEEINLSLYRKSEAQTEYLSSLQQDIRQDTQHLISLEKSIILTQKELRDINNRTKDVQYVRSTSPSTQNKQKHRLLNTIDSLEEQVNKLHIGKLKTQTKVSSLQSYIELVIKVNGDLCETLMERERAKAHLLKKARSLSPPPRYSWPKEVPYNNIMTMINDAARAQATSLVETNAIKATEDAMNHVIKVLSPPGCKKAQEKFRKARQQLEDEENNNFYDDENEEQEDEEREPQTSSSSNRKLFSHIAFENKKPSSRRVTYQSDDEYDENDVPGYLDYDEIDDDEEYKPKRNKKSKKSKASKKPTKNTFDPAASLESLYRRKKSTLTKAISRQGAITSATRLAAAANAATSAIRVATTPSPPRRTRSTSPTNIRDSKISFIPSSGTRSREFNVIASVSKAARAAKNLNATIASKVKSLHNGGGGTIFDEVPHIDLQDMQSHLRAVKKMRDSFA